MAATSFDVDRWVGDLLARHLPHLDRSEFLKAVRALSARYVERRAALPSRSPIDSAGKRAAFAAFFSPLHFITVREILAALGPAVASVDHVIDLGCGTGAAGGAWALAQPGRVDLTGVDRHPWVLEEAAWNWRSMGVRGRPVRGDLIRWIDRLVEAPASRRTSRQAVVMAWSLNELDPDGRRLVQDCLIALVSRGTHVLVVEPVSRRLVPWWSDWSARLVAAGARADEWRFDARFPAALADIDEAAGFDRDVLSARSVLASPE